MSKKGHRAYVIVINNYTEEDIQQVNNLQCIYLVYSYEVGEETQTPHIQGYVYFKDAKTMSAVSKKLKRAHLEPAYGEAEANKQYIVGPWTGLDKKTGKLKHKPYNENFVEYGVMPRQGARNDMDAVRKQLKEKPSMRGIVETATSFQSVRMAEVYLKYHETVRRFKPMVYWFYGATGTGKTHEAMSMCSDDVYVAMDTGKWFDGYDAHEYIIIDDVRSNFMSFSQWLKFMDNIPFRVETKGGTRQMLAKTMIFTSSKPPIECITEDRILHEDPNQFLDRIDVIKYFKGESKRVKPNAKTTVEIIKSNI